jgi:hypothetical protein
MAPCLTSAPDGGEWSVSCPGSFTPATCWREGWVTLEPVWMLWRREKSLAMLGIKPQYSSP